jgi:hypothetical protein
MRKSVIFIALFSFCCFMGAAQVGHLLISEFCVTPTAGEFVEIYNGTGSPVDLQNYYLYDANSGNDDDYINVVDDTYTAASYDFLCKFPSGASIANGEYIVVAMDGAAFNTTYGSDADYELLGTSGTVADMVETQSGSIAADAGLTNSGEAILLFYWDGTSDLVQDVDYVDYESGSTGSAGGNGEAIDKTGKTKDGPDGDAVASAYLNDTAVASQIPSIAPGSGSSLARSVVTSEASETSSGGNGITGHDETSENFYTAFVLETPPSPGSAYGSSGIDEWELY